MPPTDTAFQERDTAFIDDLVRRLAPPQPAGVPDAAGRQKLFAESPIANLLTN